jgi:hypothetical protein
MDKAICPLFKVKLKLYTPEVLHYYCGLRGYLLIIISLESKLQTVLKILSLIVKIPLPKTKLSYIIITFEPF